MTRPSSIANSTAWKPSMIWIDGVSSARCASTREISAPARSPVTWTMRAREWAASRPKASAPSLARSNGTPSCNRSAMRSGASRATRLTMPESHKPAPALIVSAAWWRQSSSLPIAAAMPPCAQADAPEWPGREPASTKAGKGASFSAVNSPAMPAPRIKAPSVSIMVLVGFISRSGLHRQHALDGDTGAGRDGFVHHDFMRHGLKRMKNAVQSDALHVRAEIAGPHEIDVGIFDGEIVAHRAFRHHYHAAGMVLADIADHGSGRTGEIGLRDHLRRAFGMGEHGDAGILLAEAADFLGGETLMHFAGTGPGNHFDPGLGRHVLGQILVGDHDHRIGAELARDR